MSVARDLAILFASVVGVLVLATFVARRLTIRAPLWSSETIANLRTRIGTWWAIVAILAVAFAFGKTGLIALFFVLSFAALREFMTLTRPCPADRPALSLAFFVALPLQYYLIATEWYGLFAILIPVYAFVFMPVVSAARARTNDFLRRVAAGQWGLMLSVYCLSYVPALATLRTPGNEGRGVLLVAYLLAVSQSSDVFQYVWGKLLGTTPVAATLSPRKTVEGCVLGIASATGVGAALWRLTPFAPWQAALFALLVAALGFLGGLVMSAIKRDAGVKDWSTAIAGHGGVLDRVDSLVFAAPVLFHVTRYGWALQ